MYRGIQPVTGPDGLGILDGVGGRGERLERRAVVALFIDVAGFTPMVESSDPEDVRERLSEAFSLAERIIGANGGTVEKFIGDAVLGLFGARRAHRDDVDRAVRAGLHIAAALGELDPPLRVRAGIELGEVLVDLARVEGARDLMVVGDAVNTAARLQQTAPVDAVVLGPEAARLTSALLAPAEAVSLKGKAGPIAVSRVVGPPAETGHAGRASLVGREAELSALHRALIMVKREGQPRVVFVVGEPGSGKSRLVSEFRARARAGGATARATVCAPPGERPTAAVLAEIVAPDLGGPDVAAQLGALESAHAGRARPGSPAGAVPADHVSELIGITVGLGRAGADVGAPMWSNRRNEATVAWRVYLAGLAAAGPLVLIIDDAQWLGGDGFGLLQSALARCPAPVLVVLAAWEQAALPEWGSSLPTEVVVVDALDTDDARQLARDLGAPDERVDAIVRACGGSPLYLETVIGADGSSPGAALPLGVRAAVTARLDALDPGLARTVAVASVLGPDIDIAAAAHLLGDDPTEVEDACLRLEAEGILHHVGAHLQFRHHLVAAGAAALVTKKDRRRLHALAADWMAGEVSPDLAVLGRHLEGAARVTDAVTAFQGAAEQAMGRLAVEEAAALAAHACELADADGGGWLRAGAWLARSQLEFAAGRLAVAAQAADRALGAVVPHGEEFRARALAARARAVFWQLEMDAASADAEAALEAARNSGTDLAIAEATAALALVRSSQGRPGEATSLATEARERARRAVQPQVAAMAGTVAILVHHHSGRSAEAAELIPAVAEECRRHGQPGPEIWALFKGGLAQAGLGRFDEALDTWQELVDLAHRIDSASYLCEVKNCFGHVARELGQVELADECDEQCLSEAKPLHNDEATANATLNLTAAALLRDDLGRARELLADTEPLLSAGSFFRWRYSQRYRYYRARVLELEGRRDEAIAVAEDSLSCGHQAGEGKNILRPRLQLAALRAVDAPDLSLHEMLAVGEEAAASQLLPISWRAFAAATELASTAGRPAAADQSRGRCLSVLSRIDRQVPPDRQNSWRRTVAAAFEDGDTSVWTRPL